MLKCTKLGAGVSATHILNEDVSIICYSSKSNHLAFMSISIVCIVFYLIGFPAISMTILYHNRKFLYEPHWHRRHSSVRMRMHRAVKKSRIGIIYEHYRPACYYFTVIDLLRRMFLWYFGPFK